MKLKNCVIITTEDSVVTGFKATGTRETPYGAVEPDKDNNVVLTIDQWHAALKSEVIKAIEENL